jgi:uncharacterized protein (TIGR04141 family)
VAVLDVGLPPASLADDEATYNEAAAKAIGAISVDDRPIGVGGVDRVELCDILTKDGTFIHVKKRGRSSTLSHLFAQGITSSELLLSLVSLQAATQRLRDAGIQVFAQEIKEA